MVPFPGLWVDGLADSAQDAQRCARVLGHPVVAERLQRPDGRRRRVRKSDL